MSSDLPLQSMLYFSLSLINKCRTFGIMEFQPHYLAEAENAITRYFDATPPVKPRKQPDYQQLFNRLHHHLEYLLSNNQERLWQALYRIDVPERKVRTAFEAGSLNEIASALAALIIDREVQKAETRARYRNT